MDSKYTWKESDKSYKRLVQCEWQCSNTLQSFNFWYRVNLLRYNGRNTGRANAAPLVESLEADEVDYRSIDTPKKPQLQEDPLEEEDNVGESFDDYVKRRTIEFNRLLDEVNGINLYTARSIAVLCLIENY
jgi:hypothetical protein